MDSAHGPARLSPDQRHQWRRFGWLKIDHALEPGLVTDLTRWVDDVTGWAGDPGVQHGELHAERHGEHHLGKGMHHFELTDDGPTIARSEHYADDHDGLGGFVRGRLLGDVLQQLFGEPAVLFKEKINYKHPGGGGFAPHQDATAYRFVDHHISVMVPVDPSTVASGCLHFAPGHDGGQMPTDGRGCISADVADGLAWEPIEVLPGDIVFFDSYTPHFSETNTTDRPRRVLYLTYNAASRGDFRAAYYADKAAEFEASDGTFDNERVRVSVIDDFLGRSVAGGDTF